MSIMEDVSTRGIIMDGAMGTMLIASGLGGGETAEQWVLERPEDIINVHQAYVDAGAEIVTTATFGANRIKLGKTGLADDMARINSIAVQLARKAAGSTRYVAGNIGPTGEMLDPFGTLEAEDAKQCFADQAEVLASGGVDLFLIQTFFDLNEALAAIEGTRSVSGLPIFATLTFQEKKNGFHTIMGNPVENSMKELVDAGADAVGANCSIGSDAMVRLAAEVRRAVANPVLIQPNAGSPEVRDGIACYSEKAEGFADNIRRIKELGVEIVGGCCGSTPEFIRAVVGRLRS
jgi:5-methyltetrahydrofolate--homocysteine methyltransferase